jgi:hypothetical protein
MHINKCLVLVQYSYTNCNAMTAHVCVTQYLLSSLEAQFLPEAVLSCGEPPRLSFAGRHDSHELCHSNLQLLHVYLILSFRAFLNTLFFLYELMTD